MTPYYADDAVTIYHGDCREWTGEADVIVSDPPYGVGMETFADDFSVGLSVLDSAPGLLAALFMSPRRVIELALGLPSWRFARMLWMHKPADIAAPWHGWSMNSEAILVFDRPGARWPERSDYRTDTYSAPPSERHGHAAEKPLPVVRDLVRRMTLDDGIVLDPFMGSGTTLRAAKDLGRKAIGIEIEERYCEIAATRCSQEVLGLAV